MNSVVAPNCVLFHQNLTVDFVLRSVLKKKYGSSSQPNQTMMTLFEKVVITDNERSESIEYYPQSDFGSYYYGGNRASECLGVNFYMNYSVPQSLWDDIGNDPSQDYTARETGYGITVFIEAGNFYPIPTVCKGVITNLIHEDGTVESTKKFIKPRIVLPKNRSMYNRDFFYLEYSDCTFHYKGTLNPRELHFSNFSLPAIPSVTDIFRVYDVMPPEPYTPPGDGE